MDKIIGTTDGSVDQNTSSLNWSRERLSADVHRAVGGTLNLIREVSRLSHGLDPEMPAEWMIKRTQFFAYELIASLSVRTAEPLSDDLSERDRLAALNRFLFNVKNFKCLVEMANLSRPSDAFRLSRVLAAREGSPMILSLLYAFLAEKIGIQLEFVDFNPAWFLRWNDNGRSRYIDVTRGGVTLSSDELIELMQTRYKMTASADGLLEPMTFERFLMEYIRDVKSTLSGADRDPKILLFLQNSLIAYQPSNLQLLADRAILHRRLGNFKSALSDLKRFFAFHERERCSPEIVRLHDELVALLDRR